MNIILVNPPNHRKDVDDLAPPLGLLVLANSVSATGASVELVDFNLDSCRDGLPSGEEFYLQAECRLLALRPDVVCFTSMGINSHVALELAHRLKSSLPALVTVFGGAHFSSIAGAMKARFPWVDYVLPRAGEHQLTNLVLALSEGKKSSDRDLFGFGHAQAEIKHPWSAYSKIVLSDYFRANPRRVLNVEAGRGCKYKCRFCYSPAHWGKPIEADIASSVSDFMRASQLGAKHLFLVQDNFLNDPQRAASLCLNLAELRQKPSWNCYGTLRDINHDTPDYLARGGCSAIYIGIDASTAFQRAEFGKSAFDHDADCIEKIKLLVANSVTPTCAFILDPLRWRESEVEATFRLALSLRQLGAELSLHFLTAYSKTTVGRRALQANVFIPDDFRVRLMFDCPDVVIENKFAAKNPDLFPFHVRNCESAEDFRRGVALIHVAQHLISAYPHEIADLIASGDTTVCRLMQNISDEVAGAVCKHSCPLAVKIESQSIFERMLHHDYGFRPLTTAT